MNISIIGTGYVGLVTGVCLADRGHQVFCVDIDPSKVDNIDKAIPPIHEKGLEEVLKRTVNKTLSATCDLEYAVMNTDVTFIAVGTPYHGDEIDLGFIREASRQIGCVLREKASYHLVVVKSTVVPGTTDDVVLPVIEAACGKRAGKGFGLGMNPEFLREGEAIQDFMNPDRIVMGGIDERSLEMLRRVYDVFENVEKIETNNKTAEMIKYTSNALLATMISFSNEIANLSTAVGDVDVVEVMKAVHLDKRLSPVLPDGSRIKPSFTTYLEAGCGFGGSCFPKDVKALIAHGRKHGRPMAILEAVIRTNENQPREILSLLRKHFSSLRNVEIAILGLAFKPGTDDIRE
jgi:UDPglucose 6-dehydrogenase/GDP-mannose 6-dehydrogenase